MNTREKVSELARTFAGLSYAPATRDAYLELLAPAKLDDPATRDACGHAWSCYLTTLGLWRRLGVEHPDLAIRYVSGAAPAWVAAIAASRGAERVPDGVSMPSLGDAIEVNGGEHIIAAIVSIVLEGAVATVDTIEGGQVDASGNKSISLFTGKRMRYVGRALMLGGGIVVRWFDASTLGVPDDVAPDTERPAAGATDPGEPAAGGGGA